LRAELRYPKSTLTQEGCCSGCQLAKSADVAIVFVYQWEAEGMDLPNLSLPDGQDELIERMAEANPRTIVSSRPELQ